MDPSERALRTGNPGLLKGTTLNASRIRRHVATVVGLLALGGTVFGVGSAVAVPASPAPAPGQSCVVVFDPAAPGDYSKATCSPVTVDPSGNMRDATGRDLGNINDYPELSKAGVGKR